MTLPPSGKPHEAPRAPNRGPKMGFFGRAVALRGPSDPFKPGAPVTVPPSFGLKSRRRSSVLNVPNRYWLAASALLFVGGAGVLFAAVALSRSDKWLVAPAASLQEGEAASGRDRATVLLTADGPIAEHYVFWLDSPRRLVVDVMGVKEALAAPLVAPSHPMVKRVRWARHDDRVRFVIEVQPHTSHEVESRIEGSSLLLTLAREVDTP